MIEACAWSVQCYVVNINHVLPLGSWITGLCEFSSPFCILEWSWCVRLDCQYLRLVTRRTSPLTSAFRSVILGRRRWWSDRFSGSGHSWQSWRSIAANSLKATLPSPQSTKMPREPILIAKNEGENFFSALRAEFSSLRASMLAASPLWSSSAAAPPSGSFRRPCILKTQVGLPHLCGVALWSQCR